MRFFTGRLVAVLLLLTIPSVGFSQSNADGLIMDYKMTSSSTSLGQTTTGASTAHIFMSKGRIRMETKGTALGAVPGVLQGEDLTMLMLDGGNTLVYIMPSSKRYMTVNPAELMERMNKLMEQSGGTMKYDLTSGPTLENLGPGPEILGHKTTHYRIQFGVKIIINVLDHSQSAEMKSVVDSYVAPDLKVGNPFEGMQTSGMGMALGGLAKEFADKISALYKKMPNAPPLRSESELSITGGPRNTTTRTVQEVTALRSAAVSDELFVIPKDFKAIDPFAGIAPTPPPA